MKHFLKTIIPATLLYIFIYIFIFRVGVQAVPLGASRSSTVQAKVGEFYLDASGYQSPFAAITMTLPDGTLMRSTVADSNGNFYLSQVLIRAGFTGFCLTAVDLNNVGDSEVCFEVPAANANIIKSNLFLPPTFGLAKKEVNVGSEAVIYGYSMPFANITIYLSGNQQLTATANSSGYYEIKTQTLPAGVYQLYAMANYQSKDSLQPTKTKELRILTLGEQYKNLWKEFWKRVRDFLTSLGLGPLWIAIPILILIIILLLKLYPDKFTYLTESRLYSTVYNFFHKKKKLHHAWFIGY